MSHPSPAPSWASELTLAPAGERRLALPALPLAAVCVYVLGLASPLAVDVPLAVLALLALAAVVRSRPSLRPGDAALERALVVFLVVTAVSAAGALDPARSLRLLAVFLPGILLYVLIARWVAVRDLGALVATLALAALALAATVLWASWLEGLRDPTAIVRALGISTLVVPNDVALLAVIAPLSLALLLRSGTRPVRALLALSLAATAAALVVLQSRSALAAMAAALIAVVVLLRARRTLAGLGALALAAVALDGARGFPLAAKLGRLADTRPALWLTGLAMWADAPVLGHGPRSFGPLYAAYRDELALAAWLPVDERLVPWAHSLYVEALAEQGLLGFLALVAVLGCALRAAWCRYRATEGESRALAAGTLVGLATFVVLGAIELTLLRQWVVVVACVLLALAGKGPPPHTVIRKEAP